MKVGRKIVFINDEYVIIFNPLNHIGQLHLKVLQMLARASNAFVFIMTYMAVTSRFSDQSNQVLHLTADEKEYPYQVLSDFFGDTNLAEFRVLVAKVMDTCLSTDAGPFSRAAERATLINSGRQIQRVLEASFLIASRIKEGREQ